MNIEEARNKLDNSLIRISINIGLMIKTRKIIEEIIIEISKNDTLDSNIENIINDIEIMTNINIMNKLIS